MYSIHSLLQGKSTSKSHHWREIGFRGRMELSHFSQKLANVKRVNTININVDETSKKAVRILNGKGRRESCPNGKSIHSLTTSIPSLPPNMARLPIGIEHVSIHSYQHQSILFTIRFDLTLNELIMCLYLSLFSLIVLLMQQERWLIFSMRMTNVNS